MLPRLVLLACLFGAIICCQPNWYNYCKQNSECCSQFCDKPGHWQFGVCKVGNGPRPDYGSTGPGDSGHCCSITFEQFSRAITANSYPAPTREQYNTVMNMAPKAGGITSNQELAMFLAQVLWESGGLKYKKEIACAQTQCPDQYRTGQEQPGKYYYGRGYIQLTWLYNYKPCSQDLYGDDRLVQNPDLVSDTEEGAWGSAFWYWKKNVHSKPGVQQFYFGATTKAINGGLECNGGPYQNKAKKRFSIYINVLRAFNLNVKPIEDGCY